MGYLTVKLGGSLADGVRAGTADGEQILSLACERSHIAHLIALGHAMEFLIRARENLGIGEWSEAAIEAAREQGVVDILVDTLSASPAAVALADQAQKRGITRGSAALLDELAVAVHETLSEGLEEVRPYEELEWETKSAYRKVVEAVLDRLAAKGLLP